MSNANKKVVVGLSGGVDSAVAALLLKEKGYHVSALFMKNWEEDDDREYCAAAVDLADAEVVCARLGIELNTVNFSHEYWERVFAHFLNEYQAGRTPNPDVLCNREIKFKEFLEHAQALGADHIATGHYAGIIREDSDRGDGFRLVRAKDADKDQTYFLHTLGQNALKNTIFPLAQITKREVRLLAKQYELAVHDKKDSTGICFIGERRFKDFLSRYVKSPPGEIRDLQNNVIGAHDGQCYYTVGQRQGLGIGGRGEAWYVVSKDLTENVLYVAQGHNHPALLSNWLHAEQISWVSDIPQLPFHCAAKTRHRQTDQSCVITANQNESLAVKFDQPQRALTPGQSVVFYQDQVCLGGGIITHCHALE